MKWKNDPLKIEKHLLFDGIMEFCKKFDGVDQGEISIRDLSDFIDDFFKENLFFCATCKNEKVVCVCMVGDENEMDRN